MASKRATDLGVKMTRMVMAEFPELGRSHDDEVDDVLVALGALTGGILAGIYIKKDQDGVDAAFLRFQHCVSLNLSGTLNKTGDFLAQMREQSEKGPKGVN